MREYGRVIYDTQPPKGAVTCFVEDDYKNSFLGVAEKETYIAQGGQVNGGENRDRAISVFVGQVEKLFSDTSDYKCDRRLENPLLASQTSALIDEVKENIKAGATDPTANLKTKLTVNGADFTLDQLFKAGGMILHASKPMDGLARRGGYDGIEQLGACVGMVSVYADNHGFTEEQKQVMHNAVMRRAKPYFDSIYSEIAYKKKAYDEAMQKDPKSTAIRYQTEKRMETPERALKLFKMFAEMKGRGDIANVLAQFMEEKKKVYQDYGDFSDADAERIAGMEAASIQKLLNSTQETGYYYYDGWEA